MAWYGNYDTNTIQCIIKENNGIKEIHSVQSYGTTLIGHTIEYSEQTKKIIENLTELNEKYKKILIDNHLLEPELTLEELRAENKELKNMINNLTNTVNKLVKKNKTDNKENQNNEGVNNDVNY